MVALEAASSANPDSSDNLGNNENMDGADDPFGEYGRESNE